MDNLTFLSSLAKSQLLLKQFTREHLEDLTLKTLALKKSHSENIQILLRELIEMKKENLKIEAKKANRKVNKEDIIGEVRTYIAD